MGIVDELISGGGAELLQSLTGGAGFSSEQAERFLPPATEQVVAQVKGGGLDLGSLLGGDVSSLISKLDLKGLASQAGIDPSLAEKGLESLLPVLMKLLQGKAGGANEILGSLGGDGAGAVGALGNLAGGFFKK